MDMYTSSRNNEKRERRHGEEDIEKYTQPPTVVCKNGSSVGIRAHFMHVFGTFGADLHARSVLISKIFASELSRMLIKSALLVG